MNHKIVEDIIHKNTIPLAIKIYLSQHIPLNIKGIDVNTPQGRIAALKLGYADKDIERQYIAKNGLFIASYNLLFNPREST